MTPNIEFVPENQLDLAQKTAIDALNAECFADVDQESAKNDFIAESFGRIFATVDGKIVGMLRLFERFGTFEDMPIHFGGIGGVCVTVSQRKKGIARAMITAGIEKLRERQVEFACLNADYEKTAYKLYEKIGFRLMERPISFENARGELVTDTGTMFLPLESPEKLRHIMISNTTFHYGRGYW